MDLFLKGDLTMLRKLFGKKEDAPSTVSIIAPLTGKVIPLEEVPDPVFSQKMMGDGVAITPSEGKVTSPVDGEIIQVFPTKHAIGIKAKNGAEILIHIGLDTVNMNGEGFTTHIQEGKKVKTGDLLVTYDLELVKEKARSIVTPIIITNSDQMTTTDKQEGSEVTSGDHVIMTVSKK
jgi:sugar PTS system EIIA component